MPVKRCTLPLECFALEEDLLALLDPWCWTDVVPKRRWPTTNLRHATSHNSEVLALFLFSTTSAGEHFIAAINIQHSRGNACGFSCTDRKLIDMLYDGFLVKLFNIKYVIAYSVKYFMLPTVLCVTPWWGPRWAETCWKFAEDVSCGVSPNRREFHLVFISVNSVELFHHSQVVCGQTNRVIALFLQLIPLNSPRMHGIIVHYFIWPISFATCPDIPACLWVSPSAVTDYTISGPTWNDKRWWSNKRISLYR